MRVLDEVHGYNTNEKSQLREVIAFKLKQTMDMMARAAESQGMTDEQKESIIGAHTDQPTMINAASIDSPKSKTIDSTRKPSRNDAHGTNTQMSRNETGADHNLTGDISAMSIAKPLPDRDNIDGDFKPVIIKLWQDLACNYKTQMKKIFRNIRMQREQINIRNWAIREQFLEYLHTLDDK
jgi:hypothetical protein